MLLEFHNFIYLPLALVFRLFLSLALARIPFRLNLTFLRSFFLRPSPLICINLSAQPCGNSAGVYHRPGNS